MPLSKVDNPPKGEGIQAKASKITKDVNSMQTQPPVQVDYQGANFTNQFPANLIPKDPYDDTFAMKQRNVAVNPISGDTNTQTVQRLTKDDVEYQKRKAQVANNLRYQTWLTNNINMADPKQGKQGRGRQAPKATIKKPTPAMNRRVRALMSGKGKLQSKLAKAKSKRK